MAEGSQKLFQGIACLYGLLGLGFELGYMIAIPAALAAFGGTTLDKRLGTSPVFLLVGIVLALTCSSLWVGQLIKRLSKEEK